MSQIIAPYITTWSAEQEIPSRVVERPGYGVGYADELLGDRDAHGVLWQRPAVRHEAGRPEFGKVHPLRQRRAMRKLLCQVCAGPANQNDDGVLWLLRDFQGDWPNWPEGMACTEPPVCVPCVAISLRLCPALRRGAVAVRVRASEVAGVRGALYRRGVFGPVAAQDVNLAYDDPSIRWVVASALIRELRGCTLVPLTELTEQYDAVQAR
ncbi:hypothetical protein BBK82_13615 [Lentzea guizhouensis]|uniref:Uncharacterized protein n=1 Tax=Lentzea guizhouensis TaxID=1586287 RepID=A0A1B2HGY1_9PSEU|nr:hypothetical protein [Lentzea guizhouensis]ANZ36956.1 hypothetical protein BBK82_13615 [Lentzea guizhouensis]